MPLANCILLHHYYDKVLKDKTKGNNRDGPRATTLRRVERRGIDPHSCEPPFFLPICLNPQSIQPSPALLNRPLLTQQQSTSLPYPSLLAQLSCECIHTVEKLQQFANLHPPVGPSTIVVRLMVPRNHVCKRPRVCSCTPLVVKARHGAWSVACSGGNYVPGRWMRRLFSSWFGY